MRSLLVLLLIGCAARQTGRPPVAVPPPLPAPGEQALELEPMRIDVETTPDGARSLAYDARSLLDDGNEALVLRRYDDALAAYDHLLKDFGDSRLVVPALY